MNTLGDTCRTVALVLGWLTAWHGPKQVLMLQSTVLKQHRSYIMVHTGHLTMGASGSQELGISGDLWQGDAR